MLFSPITVSSLFPLFMFIAGLAVGLLCRHPPVIIYRLEPLTKDDLLKLIKGRTNMD